METHRHTQTRHTHNPPHTHIHPRMKRRKKTFMKTKTHMHSDLIKRTKPDKNGLKTGSKKVLSWIDNVGTKIDFLSSSSF